MKTRILFIGLGMSALLLPSNSVLAVQEEKGAETITIDAVHGKITFPHGRHQNIFVDCQPCHNLFPKTPHIIAKMMGEGTLKKKEVMGMCNKCHEVRLGKGEKTGPTACKDCHGK